MDPMNEKPPASFALAPTLWAWTLTMLLFFAAPAMAHKVNVFAVAENGVIRGEAYFAGGNKAQNSVVELKDAAGRVVAKATTGPDGTFSMPLASAPPGPLTVTLKAGDGHGNDYVLSSDEIAQAQRQSPGKTQTGLDVPQEQSQPVPGGAQAQTTASPVAKPAPASPPADQPATLGLSTPTSAPAFDESRLAALVEKAAAKAVEERIAPLRLELVKLAAREDSTRLQDIVGGIGWIAGLIGIAAWFKRPKS